MSVQTSIDRLNAIKERIRTNLAAQGITVPEDTVLSEMAEQILSVAGEPGPKGDTGVGVAKVEQTTTSTADDGNNIITVTLTNGNTYTFQVQNGSKGSQGNPGTNGTNGTNGVSATHSWNGTTLTVTSASGTSSADLKGDKGDKGDTPVKGTDYFTDAEKTEMTAAAAAAIPIDNYVPKSGTTMTGALVAQANTNYTTRQVRNIITVVDGDTIPTTQNGDIVLIREA